MQLHNQAPEFCQTCPLFSTKRNFVLPEGSSTAPIAIVGMNGGVNEFMLHRPFIGASGRFIFESFKGILHNYSSFDEFLCNRGDNLYITNSCICDVLTPVPKIAHHCKARLARELLNIKPSLIIALGGQALEYLTDGEYSSITSARGYLIQSKFGLIFPMLHPSHVLRQPEQRDVFLMDATKLGRILRGEYEEEHVLRFSINSLAALAELTSQIENLTPDDVMSVDLETTGFNPFRDRIICLSLSFQDNVCYAIPLDDLIVKPYVERILKSPPQKGGQNFKFDLKFLKRAGYEVTNITFDTLIAQHIINENIPADLNSLVSYYLDYPKYDHRLDLYKKENKIKSYAELPQDMLFDYACHDANVTRLIWKKLEPIISSDYAYLFNEVELPAQITLADVELAGLPVDKKRVDELTKQVVNEIRQSEEALFTIAGGSFNYRSTQQLGKVMFEHLKLPVLKRTPTGNAATSEVVLKSLQEKLSPVSQKRLFVDLLLKLRARSKVLSTYLSGGKGGIWRFVEKDNRVHPTFRVTGTVTGRLSAKDPPIQTIPKTAIRSIFRVSRGYKFIEADLNSAELFALAHVSGCQSMLDQLKSGYDFHILTAEKIFDRKIEKHDLERKLAKFVVYGVVYGRQALSISEQFKISVEEAQKIIDSFLIAYPEIHAFVEGVVQVAKRDRVLVNYFGRTRIFPRDCKFLPAWERQALNFKPQSIVADHTNQTLSLLSKRLKDEQLDAKVIGQLHDAIMTEANDKDVDNVVSLIEEVYARPVANTDLQIPVDIDVGESWKGGDSLFN